MNNYCPDCKARLGKNKVCSCGWINKEKPAVVSDGRCVYRLGERRCPLPGTLSPHTSKSDTWYCSGHFWSQNDSSLAEAHLKYAEENYEQILEEMVSWRAKLWKQLDEEAKAIINSKEK